MKPNGDCPCERAGELEHRPDCLYHTSTKAGNIGWPLLPLSDIETAYANAVKDEDIGQYWKYRPCGRLGPWCMWMARWDLLPPGSLAPHLNRILSRPGGVETTDRGRRALITLWFLAFAWGCIGVCGWVVVKFLFVLYK